MSIYYLLRLKSKHVLDCDKNIVNKILISKNYKEVVIQYKIKENYVTYDIKSLAPDSVNF